jgi:hypothetical protein
MFSAKGDPRKSSNTRVIGPAVYWKPLTQVPEPRYVKMNLCRSRCWFRFGRSPEGTTQLSPGRKPWEMS